MTVQQLPQTIDNVGKNEFNALYRERLAALLSEDLDFHDQNSGYASHNFHSFPAKFPPQLPRMFIRELTQPGDVVLDPMMGSGTTILEAFLAGRHGVGIDIDPLALMISKVKVTSLNIEQVTQLGNLILREAKLSVKEKHHALEEALGKHCDLKTRQFIDRWFAPETQIELLALITEIEKITDISIRAFFEVVFSSIIITKSGGVSFALDLAHTRPHQAKVVITKSNHVVSKKDSTNSSSHRISILTKTIRSALEEFRRRFQQNLNGLLELGLGKIQPHIILGNAQSLPLNDVSVDLIVTSPPYASNAIDYMRAHKFSLAWMGYTIDDLGQRRNKYIGGEAMRDIALEELPDNTAKVVEGIASQDEKKGRVLHRYYSEMTRTMNEIFRVLKPGRAAIIVVGSSIMLGRDSKTPTCLAEIGQTIGFEVPKIGIRSLDRNRRMLPAGSKLDLNSQIQQRMHEEYVIGFYKPKS
jgi:DNA modification methylase